MRIYKNIVIGNVGLFENDEEIYWTTSLPEEAEIIKNENEMEYTNVIYSFEYDMMTDFCVKEIMEIMYNELSINQIKEIYKEETEIKELFNRYMVGKLKEDEIQKVSKEILDKTDRAKTLASVSLYHSLTNK